MKIGMHCSISGNPKLLLSPDRRRYNRGTVSGGPSTAVNRTIDEPENRAFLEALTSDADTVADDLSHAAHVPPLQFLLISIRGSILLQILLGIAGLLSVVLMGMGGHRPRLHRDTPALTCHTTGTHHYNHTQRRRTRGHPPGAPPRMVQGADPAGGGVEAGGGGGRRRVGRSITAHARMK